jgi:hypothetical protein
MDIVEMLRGEDDLVPFDNDIFGECTKRRTASAT